MARRLIRPRPDPTSQSAAEPPRRVMTLTYHDVADDDGPHSGFVGTGPDHYRLTPSVFARHLDAIASSGIAPSSVTDARGQQRRPQLAVRAGGRAPVTAA